MGHLSFIRKFIFVLIFSCLFSFFSFSQAVAHVAPIEGIDWIFETTMGFQNLNNMMAKEGGSSSQTNEALFFSGILYSAYYNKLPFLKAQMNMGFSEQKNILWTANPNFNHENQMLNESLRCIEVDVHYLMPSVIGYRGFFYPFLGYSFLNYSYYPSYSTREKESFQFHAFFLGLEYSARLNRFLTHDYYFSFSPIMLNNSGKKRYFYYNYGTEVTISATPVSLKVFLAFKNGFNEDSKLFDKETYTFSNSEVGISFHANIPNLW